MRLYHFTALDYLPEILRDGLSKGAAIVDARTAVNGISLTTNPLAEKSHWYDRGDSVDRTRIRLSFDIADGDTHLERFADFCKRKRVSREIKRALDPLGQGKFWWYYWGTIPAGALTVEIREGTEYRRVADLDGLLSQIIGARMNVTVDTNPITGAVVVRPSGTHPS